MPTPFELDPRPLVAFDWSARWTHATADGRTVTAHASIDELLDTLTAPTKLVAEATFESFDPGRRTAVLERVRADGHELYVYRPKNTKKKRPADSAKSDVEDARVIFALAASGRVHVYPAPTPHPAWIEFREATNREYNIMRNSGRKPELKRAAMALLGPYAQLSETQQAVYGSGAYSESLLAAAYFAATKARSGREYERLLGLHESGYPSLLRSDIHNHSFRHATKRGATWRTFRGELRRIYRLVRSEQARLAEQA